MNDKEKQGIASILRMMPGPDVIALAETITCRMVHVTTENEAINVIIKYSTSAMDVLLRRKMKKEYVHRYLVECGRVVPATTDKVAIVRCILELWQSREFHEGIELMEEEDVETPSIEANHSFVGNNDANGSSFQSELETMANQFVTWFYPLLNNGHLSNPNSADNFGPHHFWRDCKMKINSPQYEQLAEGDETVSRSLLSLIGDSQLYFNPFDAQRGVRCECDPHGLVVILVGGSLHRCDDDAVGIFEQKFGLVRDPSIENKWKIKLVELQLCGKDLNVACPLDAPIDCPFPAVGGTTTLASSSSSLKFDT